MNQQGFNKIDNNNNNNINNNNQLEQNKQPIIKKQNNQNIQKSNQQDQLNYYNQYCRLFLANAVLSTQLKQLNTQKADLIFKLSKLQKKGQEISQGNSGTQQKKKRMRRSAAQIARHYKCSIQTCAKSYGSQGSLNQHIKLKHPDLYKTMAFSLQGAVKEQPDQGSPNSQSQHQDQS